MAVVKFTKAGVALSPDEKSEQAAAGKDKFYFPSLDVFYAHLQALTRADPLIVFAVKVDPGDAVVMDVDIVHMPAAPKPADPQ